MANQDQSIESLILNNQLIPHRFNDIISIEIIKNGMTNNNYLCNVNDGSRYVIRVPGDGTDRLIDRLEEWKNHQQIKKLNLDVETIFFDKHTGIKVSKYIDDFFPLIRRNTDRLTEVCRVLKEVHKSGIIFENKFFGLTKLHLYESIADEKLIGLHPDYYLIKTELHRRNIGEYLQKHANWSPCHNDPVAENFLMDSNKKIYLIDWEYSGMNDPLWDLSAFSLENDLSYTEEKIMLEIYFDETPDEKTTFILLLHKIYQDILWYVWSKIKIQSGADLVSYSNMRLTRATKNFSEFSGQVMSGEK
jgi:thiamine kinase-like enzyme